MTNNRPHPPHRPAILETNGITRRYDDLVAVDHVSFSIEEGAVFGLVGLNGAGKSTLIKMLITLVEPSEGTATVCGFDIGRRSSDVRRVIGYVPQMVSADGDLTASENLSIYAKLYDVPVAERKSRVEQSLEFMDLSEVSGKLVREFSGGMVRRLEIAQSMLHRPRLLFLDEPTVGLDPVARTTVWKHIAELRERYGTSIFLTTHLLDEVEHLCTQVGIMSHGRLAALGTLEELKSLAGGPSTTLDEVFIHFAGVSKEGAGGYREAKRTRRTARRLG